MADASSTTRSPSSRSSADGFSLLELLLAMLTTAVIAGAALSITLSCRRLVDHDEERSRVNQDLRLGLDLLGIEVRQAGERLPGDFPALEIVDGGGAPDVLVVRRNLLDEVLPLCETIGSGTVTDEIMIADGGASPPPGCVPVADEDGSTWPDNVDVWRAHRDAQGGSVLAYVYNPVTRLGEFLLYDGDGSTSHHLHKADTGAWQHDYPTTQQCRVYVIEERRFELAGDTLQLVVNGDAAGASRLLHGISAFEVRAEAPDGSLADALGPADDWGEIASLELSVTGETLFKGQPMTRTVTSRFFPRNVLSL